MKLPGRKPDNPNKDWLDWWLADEPASGEAKQKLRQERVAQANTYKRRQIQDSGQPPAEPGLPNVTVNINFPKLGRPDLKKLAKGVKAPKLPWRRLALSVIVLGIAVIGLTSGGRWLHNHSTKAPSADAASTPANIPLSFTPVAPKTKPQLAKLSSGNSAYDASRGTYSYQDAILGTPVTISEQAIPPAFTTPEQAVAKAAASFGAKNQLTTNSGIAYLFTSPSNTQIVVFSVNNLLIFGQSNFRHDNSDWVSYINGF